MTTNLASFSTLLFALVCGSGKFHYLELMNNYSKNGATNTCIKLAQWCVSLAQRAVFVIHRALLPDPSHHPRLIVCLHITTLTHPACHPASYGPLSRPQTLHSRTQITRCLLQALQAVGPQPMGCQTLLKQEHINVSVCGCRAGPRQFTAAVVQVISQDNREPGRHGKRRRDILWVRPKTYESGKCKCKCMCAL